MPGGYLHAPFQFAEFCADLSAAAVFQFYHDIFLFGNGDLVDQLYGDAFGLVVFDRNLVQVCLFDFGTDDVGKPLGIDIKEKKLTLPLIYTLSNCSRETRRTILNIVKNESHKPEKVAEVIRIVRESGGLEYASEAMYQYRAEAFELLEQTAPDSPARNALRDLVTFVTERKK